MGADNSKELLALPLRDQSNHAFLASGHGQVTEVSTTVLCTGDRFIDARTDKAIYELESQSFSSKVTLQIPDGLPVLTMKSSRTCLNGYDVYGGATEKKDVAFTITDSTRTFGPFLFHADFMDQRTHTVCRLLIEGHVSDDVAIVYLQRGHPTALPPLAKEGNDRHPACQAVARIYRPPAKTLFTREYPTVEVAPGVDLTVVLLLWKIRNDIAEARRNA